MTKKSYLQEAIEWAKRKRLSNLKANYEDYETPKSYTRDDADKPFVPDITGNKLSKKIYVEIAMKTDNIKRVVSKWKLLDTLASIKQGKLYLLAPRGHKAFAERQLKQHDLTNAQVVYLG